MFRPLDDLTLEEAMQRIFITVGEHNSGHCKREHLIDDFTVSRNIARFGLKFTTFIDLCGEKLNIRGTDGRSFCPFLWHIYTESTDSKLRKMLGLLATPKDRPAFPVLSERGEMAIENGFPVLRLSGGRTVPNLGNGWGLMSPEDAMSFRERWRL
jgi:hypothetical protein